MVVSSTNAFEGAVVGDSSGGSRRRTLLKKHYLTEEVNRLLALYRQVTDRPPTAGGAQHLLMKSGTNFDFASSGGSSSANISFSDLPVSSFFYCCSVNICLFTYISDIHLHLHLKYIYIVYAYS